MECMPGLVLMSALLLAGCISLGPRGTTVPVEIASFELPAQEGSGAFAPGIYRLTAVVAGTDPLGGVSRAVARSLVATVRSRHRAEQSRQLQRPLGDAPLLGEVMGAALDHGPAPRGRRTR
jgi:hypothetical protein